MTYRGPLISDSSSDTTTKKGHLLILTDARDNIWEKRWFVLRRFVSLGQPRGISLTLRPYLHIYANSNEVEELGVISLTGVNIENDPQKASLL